ncbi:hypothetical protein BC833DRAFT_565533 [Globomyces pollinis-pini]|nr:hypothetical protein BC833DRAFT_565533 [Globomyces pollinis-pini]
MKYLPLSEPKSKRFNLKLPPNVRREFSEPYDAYLGYLLDLTKDMTAFYPGTEQRTKEFAGPATNSSQRWTLWVSKEIRQLFDQQKSILAPTRTHGAFVELLLVVRKMLQEENRLPPFNYSKRGPIPSHSPMSNISPLVHMNNIPNFQSFPRSPLNMQYLDTNVDSNSQLNTPIMMPQNLFPTWNMEPLNYEADAIINGGESKYDLSSVDDSLLNLMDRSSSETESNVSINKFIRPNLKDFVFQGDSANSTWTFSGMDQTNPFAQDSLRPRSAHNLNPYTQDPIYTNLQNSPTSLPELFAAPLIRSRAEDQLETKNKKQRYHYRKPTYIQPTSSSATLNNSAMDFELDKLRLFWFPSEADTTSIQPSSDVLEAAELPSFSTVADTKFLRPIPDNVFTSTEMLYQPDMKDTNLFDILTN